MTSKAAILALADGSIYHGIAVGAPGDCVGELVFNTAMTGYQEILSDPSYARQIVTLTMPHVGNTGCNEEDMESSRVWAAGLVIRNCSLSSSNYRNTIAFPDFLKKHGVVAIDGIDTRQLTLLLRTKGAIAACITTLTDDPQLAVDKAKAFVGLNGADLASTVSRKTKQSWDDGRGEWGSAAMPLRHHHVVAYDFGVKHTILRILKDKGCHITLVPAQTSAQAVLDMNPDGIFLSNGPGDPEACQYAIAATKQFLQQDIPVFGICLGFQILALACDAQSLKMKFGHHGANHPVINTEKKVMISSQNHGFAIDESTLPDCLEVTHRSLFDGSLQGIRHKHKSAFGFQGHPEASPGPHDVEPIFNQFISMMNTKKILIKE